MLWRRCHLLVVCATLGAAVLAAGCGGDGSDEASATTQATTTTTETTTAATTTTETTTTAAATGETETTGMTSTFQSTETEATPTSTRNATTSDVSRFLFRTKGNVILCGRDDEDLACFVSRSGVTVTLPPRGRPSRAEIKDENRGVPARARSAPVLRKGHPVKSGPFTCALRKGEVRCTNAGKHGFLLGPSSLFRF